MQLFQTKPGRWCIQFISAAKGEYNVCVDPSGLWEAICTVMLCVNIYIDLWVWWLIMWILTEPDSSCNSSRNEKLFFVQGYSAYTRWEHITKMFLRWLPLCTAIFLWKVSSCRRGDGGERWSPAGTAVWTFHGWMDEKETRCCQASLLKTQF